MPPAHIATAAAKQKLLLLAPVPFRTDLLDRKLWRRRLRAQRRRPLPLAPVSPALRLADLLPVPGTSPSAVRRASKLLRRILLPPCATETSGPMTQQSRFHIWTEQFPVPVLMSALLRRVAKETASTSRPPSTRKRTSASATRSSASNPASGSNRAIMLANLTAHC